LLADREILAVEDTAIHQLEGTRPVRLFFGVGRKLWRQHRMDEQRLVWRAREHAEMADVVRMIDNDAVGKDEVNQRAVHLWAPVLRRQGADFRRPVARDQIALVQPYCIADRYRIGEERTDRAGMQARDVIDLE